MEEHAVGSKAGKGDAPRQRADMRKECPPKPPFAQQRERAIHASASEIAAAVGQRQPRQTLIVSLQNQVPGPFGLALAIDFHGRPTGNGAQPGSLQCAIRRDLHEGQVIVPFAIRFQNDKRERLAAAQVGYHGQHFIRRLADHALGRDHRAVLAYFQPA